MTIFSKQKLVRIFFCVFTTLSFNSISLSAAPEKIPYYADHCASFVPESTLNTGGRDHPQMSLHTGYYYEGNGKRSQNSSYNSYSDRQNTVEFKVWSSKETNEQGLFKLRANLQVPETRTYYSRSGKPVDSRRPVNFRLQGFWSESSGKLCMVGYGMYSKQRTSLHYPAVVKLYNFINSTTITSLISGTIESFFPASDTVKDPRYFNPISFFMLPEMNYQYTLASNISTDSNSIGETDGHKFDAPSSSLEEGGFCSQLSYVLRMSLFDLKYSSKCISASNCNPLVVLDHLPPVMLFKDINCSESGRSLRVLVEFTDSGRWYWYGEIFNPNTTLVAEGSWNAKKNQLQLGACHFLEAAADSFNNSHVGDCSTRLSMSFPATWTIGNTSSVVGHLWSNKSKTESGYFEKITFESQRGYQMVLLPGTKYEYTKLDRVNKLCPRKKTAADAHNNSVYPSPFSYDMRFDMSAQSSKGLVAWGYSTPVSMGDKLYEEHFSSTQYTNSAATEEAENYSLAPLSFAVMMSSYDASKLTNISYRISIKLLEPSAGKLGNITIQSRPPKEIQISAEGIYDTEGSLCMVGCRTVGLNSNHPTLEDIVDCEILVNFQFPPENEFSSNTGRINVSIESTRQKSDPLHFERLDLSSAANYMIEAERSIWRMNMETTFVLVSNTLACVFVALQLFHVKKNPDVLPSVSILMLLILTLGHLIPIIINFDGLFTHNTSRRHELIQSGGWLAANEVVVRVITMVAFLLQFRLLQQTWSARSANATQKEFWDVEKKTLPLYIIGFFAASMHLRSFAGLVLDGFLLPQILLNMVCKSKEKALCVSFYIGTTMLRVLPHAYDIYRTRSSVHQQLDESYIYASPVADFYSTAWDVIIPIGGLVLSLFIFLQQKFGGRCFLPQKLRELGSYKEIPQVGEVDLPN